MYVAVVNDAVALVVVDDVAAAAAAVVEVLDEDGDGVVQRRSDQLGWRRATKGLLLSFCLTEQSSFSLSPSNASYVRWSEGRKASLFDVRTERARLFMRARACYRGKGDGSEE